MAGLSVSDETIGFTLSRSSFVIVPVARARANDAFVAAESVTTNVSSPSTSLSPITSTEIVFAVSPGEKVNVPDAAR